MNQLLKSQILLLLIFFSLEAYPQSAWQEKPKTTFSGFIDVFYVYDFNKPETDYRQPFFYNHNRHNEFNLNLGYLKVSLEHARYRANLALQTGTYPNDNYAAEPGALKNVFEANAGIALNSKSNLWLDAAFLDLILDLKVPFRSTIGPSQDQFWLSIPLTLKQAQNSLSLQVINGKSRA